MALTGKQQRWAEAYAGPAEGNATRAAELAGYSGGPNAWGARGAENVANRKVMDEVRRLSAHVRQEAMLDVKNRQEWLAKVVDGEVDDVYPTKIGPVIGPPGLRARQAASDQLNRMQGVYTTKHEVEHKGGRVVFFMPDDGRGPAPE